MILIEDNSLVLQVGVILFIAKSIIYLTPLGPVSHYVEHLRKFLWRKKLLQDFRDLNRMTTIHILSPKHFCSLKMLHILLYYITTCDACAENV